MIFIYLISAVIAYLISSWNPSIFFAQILYHEDIREKGSGNPGFTNFRRVYGKKYSWAIFWLDIGKAAIVMIVFGLIFRAHPVTDRNMYQVGVAWTGFFCMMGQLFPCWYQFKGGKGYLVSLSVILCIHPVAAVVGFAFMVVLLYFTRTMSLSTMSGNVVGVIMLCFLHVDAVAVIVAALCILMMIIRHSQNILRLIQGTESKSNFSIFEKIDRMRETRR